MANKFSVPVGRGYGHLLTEFGDRMVKSGERRDEKEGQKIKQEYIAEMKSEASKAYNSGDIDAMINVSLAYPEISGSMSAAMQHKSERTEQNYQDVLFDFYVDPTEQNATDIITARQTMLGEEGADSAETDGFLDKVRTDPVKAQKEIEKELAFRYPEKMGKLLEMTSKTGAKDTRTASQKDWEYYDILKETDPEGAKLFGVKTGIIKEDGIKKAAELKDVLEFRKHVNTNPVIKDYLAVDTQVKRLDQTVKDVDEQRKSGKPVSYIAVDQALITILNKMLDPTSVVRESEYARTPGDQAAIARIKGKWDQLRTGGASLTDNDRDSVLRMARRFSTVAKDKMGPEVNSYKRLAKDFGVDFNNIISPTLLNIEEENKQTFSGGSTKNTQAPAKALEMLNANPNMAASFKEKYGYLPEGY